MNKMMKKKQSTRKPLVVLAAITLLVISGIGLRAITHPAKQLRLTNHGLTTSETGDKVFTGTIQNWASNPATNITIEIGFFDNGGGFVGNTTATTNRIEPDQIWKMEIVVPGEQATKFRINQLHWHDDKRNVDHFYNTYRIRDL